MGVLDKLIHGDDEDELMAVNEAKYYKPKPTKFSCPRCSYTCYNCDVLETVHMKQHEDEKLKLEDVANDLKKRIVEAFKKTYQPSTTGSVNNKDKAVPFVIPDQSFLSQFDEPKSQQEQSFSLFFSEDDELNGFNNSMNPSTSKLVPQQEPPPPVAPNTGIVVSTEKTASSDPSFPPDIIIPCENLPQPINDNVQSIFLPNAGCSYNIELPSSSDGNAAYQLFQIIPQNKNDSNANVAYMPAQVHSQAQAQPQSNANVAYMPAQDHPQAQAQPQSNANVAYMSSQAQPQISYGENSNFFQIQENQCYSLPPSQPQMYQRSYNTQNVKQEYSGSGPNICLNCGRTCKSKHGFHIHLGRNPMCKANFIGAPVTRTGIRPPIQPSESPETVRKYYLFTSSQTTCQFCNSTFSSAISRRDHEKECHAHELRSVFDKWRCNNCGFQYLNEKSFNRHLNSDAQCYAAYHS